MTPRTLLMGKGVGSLLRSFSRLLSSTAGTSSSRVQWSDRTHTCGELTTADTGREVSLSGWVQFVRMGGRFVLLRDAHGATQLSVSEVDLMSLCRDLTPESVITVKGVVERRPSGQENSRLATGDIEVDVKEARCLSRAAGDIPIMARDFNRAKEETGMRHRYLALRYPDMQRRLRRRSEVIARMRQFLTENSFVDVDTPTLFRKTPGGAQEFVVPTRHPGQFYSLVQSPQQFKQLLMVGGLDRYFQVARCYRDEGARPDRQPEFTQVDIELSFTNRAAVKSLVEGMLRHCWPSDLPAPPGGPFPTLTHDQAISRYGSDKPDLRFDSELTDLTKFFAGRVRFLDRFLAGGGVIKGVAVNPSEGKKVSSAELRELESTIVKLAEDGESAERPLLVSHFAVNGKGELKSSVLRKSADAVTKDVVSALQLAEGAVGFFASGPPDLVDVTLGRARTRLSHLALDLPAEQFSFVWVEDFPLFCRGEDGGLESSHHPFTRPHPMDEARLTSEPLSVRGEHYDLVLNGYEVAGGSIRIHEPDMQRAVIEDILGMDPTEFGHMLEALTYGCPPHGGVAIGLDRLLAVMLDCESIRDVMAFPKTATGRDLMSGAPTPIKEEEKELYHIDVRGDSVRQKEDLRNC